MKEKIFTLKQLAASPIGEQITIGGMVHNNKDMGKFSFITLRLADALIQCIYDHSPMNEDIKNESSIYVTGKKSKDIRSPHGFEIIVSEIDIISQPYREMPVIINRRTAANIETQLKYRPASLRSPYSRMIFRLQSGLVMGFREYFLTSGFTEIFTPKIVAGGAEGGANIFSLEYFGNKAYLAQSPQFYKQTMIPVYQRVFEIAPVFRAEKHNTPRHLNEYISIDGEIGFIESFYDICRFEEDMLRFCFEYLKENYRDCLEGLGLKLEGSFPEGNECIPALKFKNAKEMVSKRFSRKIKDPYDLEPEEERLISQMIKEDTGSDFVYITHYPAKKRPFYVMDDPEDGKYTLSFDLLYKGMEITTGGQRIHNYSQQLEKMVQKGLDPSDFESYLMLHKYGCPPHGGFGIGLERLMMKLTEASNIREVSMFPRDTTHVLP